MTKVRTITKQVTVTRRYYSIKFDGTNEKDLLRFLTIYGFNINNEKEFQKRPEGIPNLDPMKLSDWWEFTGFRCYPSKHRWTDWSGKSRVTYGNISNTHGCNNFPDWQKDEVLQFYVANKSKYYDPENYYCHKIGIKVGDIFIYTQHNGELEIYNENVYVPDEIKELLNESTEE